MQRTRCKFDNPQDIKFCVNCGTKLEMIFSKCGSNNSPVFNFCGQSGNDLSKSAEAASLKARHETHISESSSEETIPTRFPAEGERKGDWCVVNEDELIT